MKKKNFSFFAIIISIAILLTVFAFTTELAAATPTGTISINSGDLYTTSRTVTLTLTYSSSTFIPVTSMRFSEDFGSTWGSWHPVATTYTFSIADPGDGWKYVDVQFRDALLSVSSAGALYDGIYLDTVAPTGTIVINSGDLYTTSRTVTLTLSATDATSGLSKMRFSEEMGTWGPWVNYATTYSYTLTSPNDGQKDMDVQFQDKAGLISPAWAHYDKITLDTVAPTGTIVINSGDAFSY